MSKLRLAVAGVGAIGRRHAELIAASPRATLAGLVDPAPAAAAAASQLGAPLFAALDDLFAAAKPDGIVLATPNALHLPHGLACIAAGVPTLIEKPVAHTLAAGRQLLAAAEAVDATVMVGHHRQHGSVMAKAIEIVASGALGRIVAIVGTTLFYKAESEGYFDGANAWRREPGGGPVLTNMIHEAGTMRALAGEIAEVQAFTSHATRGFAVEDTAVVNFRFASGALGTFALSDTAATNRSWEQTSGEDMARFGRAHTDEHDCYLITGTQGSLAVPTMRLQRYATVEGRSWHKPLAETRVPFNASDPLAVQIEHFCDVIEGRATPRVGLRDGVANLAVVDAILISARSGRSVSLS